MVRAAAKNYDDVTVITSPNQYEELIDQLEKTMALLLLNLDKKCHKLLCWNSLYDAVISDYFNKLSNINFLKKNYSTEILLKN